MKLCVLCNAPAECRHHLIFGNSRRKLADEDDLIIDLCNSCHNLAIKPMDRIHDNPQAERLSKMLGQAIWERNYIEKNHKTLEDAKRAFIGRYGRNYLI